MRATTIVVASVGLFSLVPLLGCRAPRDFFTEGVVIEVAPHFTMDGSTSLGPAMTCARSSSSSTRSLRAMR